MTKPLKDSLPEPMKKVLKPIYNGSRNLVNYVVDWLAWLKNPGSMVPRESMIFVGTGDFQEVGQKFKRYFIEVGGLRPDHKVLDVGCGIARMAIPLTDYLAEDGEYWGFDIVKRGIRWSRRHVSRKFPRFHFLHSDVFNRHYNPGGKMNASEYRFPFSDGHFDFVFLTSVFTHMLPADMEHYLGEIYRVLRPGGRVLATYFLWNEQSQRLVREGRGTLRFDHTADGYVTTHPDNPEAAVAYDEHVIRRLFAKHRLAVEEPVHFGSWCERPKYLSYQDVIVAVKTSMTGNA
jgi:ubiquinone/menaquinone biosynthesis C-methylase UbiE